MVYKSWMKYISPVLQPQTYIITAMGFVFATPAFADRHCFPALDSYYAARQNIISPAENDAGALLLATENIAAALNEAELCGCEVLQRRLGGLVDSLKKTNTTNDSVRQQVLDAEVGIFAALEQCHR